MKKPKLRLVMLTALILGISSTLSFSHHIPEDKEVIKFLNEKWGDVTFLHGKHAGMQGIDCVTCHHTMTPGETPQSCHACHSEKPPDGTPSMVKAFHTRCRGCHQYTIESGMSAGPVKLCNLCHISRD